MKKLIALVTLLALCCTACIGMAETADADLAAARSYLRMMYKNSPETTTVDFNRVAVLNIGGVEYPVTWTTDTDAVKIIVNEDDEEVFLSATDVLDADLDASLIPEGAELCRIVVEPTMDAEVGLFEIEGYAGQLSISYNK